MTVPSISATPPPPLRSDAPVDFAAKADAFLGAFPTLATQVNASNTWVNTQVTTVAGHASTATTKATDAATSATAAATAKTAAETAKTAAETSKTAAANSATSASTSATNAATSATSASTSATTATTKATEATNSATKASQWAENAENVTVETGKYSAKHYSLKASASATGAASSATTATTKASEAATSATNAATSATTATTKASEASTSATAAATAKTAAEAAKTAAETAKNTAVVAKDDAVAARDRAESAAAAMVGGFAEFGAINLSGGVYPAKPLASGLWRVSVAGTVGGVDFAVGDNLVYSKNLDIFYKIDNSDAVTSVAGKTGVVTLAKADVGLGNVDNTSDASKPVSTAQQTALNLKANLASPPLTGTPTAPTAAQTVNNTQLATTAYTRTAVANHEAAADPHPQYLTQTSAIEQLHATALSF